LAQMLARQRPLSLHRAAPILAQVCEALAAAHDAGVIHRDVKPDNVLVEPGGRVVVTDFGIARSGLAEDAATRTARPAGAPAYLAPEQIEGGEITPRADLYALGAMMFELLTGQMPWRGDSVYVIALRRLRE